MGEKLHPDNGGRVLLELLSAEPGEVRYQVTLFTPDDRFEGTAVIDAKGRSTVEGLDEAPPWLSAQVGPFLRQLWTARRDGGPRWPRRVMRWRQER